MRQRPVDRRTFLAGSAGAMGAAVFGGVPLGLLAEQGAPPPAQGWDSGQVRHLLPQVSDSRMLIKASFTRPTTAPPTLRIGTTDITGRMNDTTGEYWQFYASDLVSGRRYELSLRDSSGASLCEPWSLATFPGRDTRPERFRMLFFTCAGGPGGTYSGLGERTGFLPTVIRNRLLRRALSFEPDAAVANGDHIYWDLHTWLGDNVGALSPSGQQSNFNFSDSVFSASNEAAMKAAAGPQIVPVYGTDFRSTPIFFLQDDHDHWENDAAGVFPVPWFQLQMARATQQLYYPEFLPDPNRPANLPWSSVSDRGDLSESFGTIRYGNLAEVLLYDVRRTMSLGPMAVFIDPIVEEWLLQRTSAPGVQHLVHAPSNPMGWSAGKWGEWYPDVLHPETGQLTTQIPKPHWQQGWLNQHDRIMQSLADMKHRNPLVIAGDLHATGVGTMYGAGNLDFSDNPITNILCGPVSTSIRGFPSVVRGVRPAPSQYLNFQEQVPPFEEHGFSIVDFEQDRIVAKLFKWDVNSQPVDAIDTLEPYYTVELDRP